MATLNLITGGKIKVGTKRIIKLAGAYEVTAVPEIGISVRVENYIRTYKFDDYDIQVNGEDAGTDAEAIVARLYDEEIFFGAEGITGGGSGTGTNGDNGWTPVISIYTDGARRVQKVIDWTGGTGAKPAINRYISASGFTTVLADAEDIRGAMGATGAMGSTGPAGATGAQGPAGASGSGSGDMVRANNLSDVANAATARTNLGVASKITDVAVSAGRPLTSADIGKRLVCDTSSAAIVLTVPNNLATSFEKIFATREGANTLSWAAGSGATVYDPYSVGTTTPNHGTTAITWRSSSTWAIEG